MSGFVPGLYQEKAIKNNKIDHLPELTGCNKTVIIKEQKSIFNKNVI